MKLYQINQSQYAPSIEADWQLSLVAGDAVLFIEVGVLRCLIEQQKLTALLKSGIAVYFREQDLKANGLSTPIGEPISDQQWVNLTTQFEKVVTW